MGNNKIWKIRNVEGSYSDEELIELIRSGKISGDSYVTTKEMKVWITVSDSIYQYYIRREEDEIL